MNRKTLEELAQRPEVYQKRYKQLGEEQTHAQRDDAGENMRRTWRL